MSTLPSHFALVVFPGYEVLDAFGPSEVIHCLGSPRVHGGIKLSIIGPALEPVSSAPVEGTPVPSNPLVGQTIVPTHTYDAPPNDVDVLIVPGGMGAGHKSLFGGEWEPPCAGRVAVFLKEQYPKVKYLLTVCNGASLAARAGILDGHKATTNKMFWKQLTDGTVGPKTHWIGNARWVVADNGKLWTSSGVSAGTDAMLALVDHIYGKNDKGMLYGDDISNTMEWNRARDPAMDPFAKIYQVEDVLPRE